MNLFIYCYIHKCPIYVLVLYQCFEQQFFDKTQNCATATYSLELTLYDFSINWKFISLRLEDVEDIKMIIAMALISITKDVSGLENWLEQEFWISRTF